LLLALASYFISDCLWSAFFTSKRHKPFHHVKVYGDKKTEQGGIVVILHTFIRDVLGSNLCRDIGYAH
jgi:hypothetical protein